ncbi:MAG: DUF2490 domain-containing protein [Bacteroidales bacterium]|nr:DUF2490 domain-containing protein [Bacteroidales bacterium]
MQTIIKVPFLVLLLMFCAALSAQQEDFQTRIGVGVSGEVFEDFAWSVKAQQRWRYNSSVNDRTLLQGGVSYSPLSFLKIGLGYRASFIHQQEGPSVYKQRIHTNVFVDHRLDRFKFKYRSRLQYGFDDFQTLSFIGGQALTWRHRIGVKYYPFGWPLRPQASVEIFNKLNTTDERGLNGIRYIIGTEYLLSYHLSLSADYIINKEINVSNPFTENIISASISYSF